MVSACSLTWWHVIHVHCLSRNMKTTTCQCHAVQCWQKASYIYTQHTRASQLIARLPWRLDDCGEGQMKPSTELATWLWASWPWRLLWASMMHVLQVPATMNTSKTHATDHKSQRIPSQTYAQSSYKSKHWKPESSFQVYWRAGVVQLAKSFSLPKKKKKGK